jgi:putative transposase
MRGTRFKQEQIIAILREAKAGVKLSELSRKHGISEARYTTGRPSTAI